jgi:hypothetical protein
MVHGRGGLGSPRRTANRGRHDRYRYLRPVHKVGMARHGGYKKRHAHTTTKINYNAKNGGPHRYHTTPYLILVLDQSHTYTCIYYLSLGAIKGEGRVPFKGGEGQPAAHKYTSRHPWENYSTSSLVFILSSSMPRPRTGFLSHILLVVPLLRELLVSWRCHP